MKRTHHNNELNINHLNEEVRLRGWVAKTRNLGGMLFIDLRDKEGITQIVVKPDNPFYEKASAIKQEYVIYVEGIVIERESKNKNIFTGDIEVIVSNLVVLNTAELPPITIAEDIDALEQTRLKYRYLDLRRKKASDFLRIRNEVYKVIRDYLYERQFVEIETPILGKSTPEGARDYLVPSRVHKGEFFALPQSPQIFKQLLMIGGLEKYYQIVKCFRDEDLRSDRQPEFTQLDIEESFVTQEDVIEMSENLIKTLFKRVKNYDVELPIQRMTYEVALNKYGSDKPDLRFEMLIEDLTEIFIDTDFRVFQETLQNEGVIKAVIVKNGADKYSRKKLDVLTQLAKRENAQGLAWLKYEDDDFMGSIKKVVSTLELNTLKKAFKLENNDLILIVSSENKIACQALGAIRLAVAKDLDLIRKEHKFVWITDFPLFEYDKENKRYKSAHHPFTAVRKEDLALIVENPKACIAQAYDLVLDGQELGGGSIRISNQEEQAEVFKALSFSEEELQEQFGFLLEALKYGTPPHGGIAFGLDRIVMSIANTENIRDVIAFPKTQKARCLLMDSPNKVANEQLDELHIEIKKD